MSRFTRARYPRARIAVLATALVATAVGLSPATVAQASPVVGIDQLDITPNWRTVPRQETVLAVGPTGYAHRTEDSDEHSGEEPLWTDFASGATVPLGYGSGNEAFGERGTGGRYVYLQHGIGTHYLRDVETGEEKPLTIPEDTGYRGILGETLLFQQYEPGSSYGTTTGYLLRRAGDPDGTPIPVTGWPEGADLHTARLVAGDGATAVLRFKSSASYAYTDLAVVDLRTGAMRVIASSTPSAGVLVGPVAVTSERIAWVDSARTVHIRRLSDLDTPGTVYPLPEGFAAGRIGLAGEWVIAVGEAGGTDAALHRRLVAFSPTGAPHPLLERAEGEINQIGDGSGVAVVGGTSATDWSLLKVVPGKGGGAPALEKLRRLEPLPAKIDGLALGAGRLTTLEYDGPKGPGFYGRTLPVGPVHTGQGTPAWQGVETNAEWRRTPLFDSGDGRTVSLPRIPYTARAVVSRAGTGRTTRVAVDQDGRIGDAFGRWAVFQSGTPTFPGTLVSGGETVVVNLDASTVVSRQSQTAAALWGDTLFTGTATVGEVARKDLASGKDLGKVATGSGCPLTELQTAGGRWLYWACGQFAQQGVVDLKSGARIALPRSYGEGGLLGDGYYVDQYSSYLRITDFSGGTAKAARPLVDTRPVYGARREAWTVDRFGGAVAYQDAEHRVHVVWPGVPTSDLAAASASVPASMRMQEGWKASWALSKPASIWRVTVRDRHTGNPLRSFGADETRGRIDASWDGRTAAGKPVANGTYSWHLQANSADGQGRDLSLTGTVTVTGGKPALRDMAGNDTQGDLLAMDTAGLVSMYRGDGYGGLSGRYAGTGAKFATTSVLVPFGDVNGDGCADVLARVGDQLRAYRPGCGKVVSASSPYTLIGSGWSQYDVLTSPGDANGDGFTDLIVRQASSGDMYFYAGTADHRMKSRVRIGTDWKLYRKITGVGDLNGDGRGDLLGVDASGALWRYHGTATGGVTARVKLGHGWNIYSSLVGTGDISGDGCPDLVARETSGTLYSYLGTCRGTYSSRILIGGGWNMFKALF
ncbi:FG-GAP-like repeat-containing protein [Streptomyces sp. NPDC058671]|uniref:FG-GAP-like repeat-containing protein n=1 Tax=Streptomyces sp. NPDC058671 TaxID=3346590 RepID=UPI00366269EF